MPTAKLPSWLDVPVRISSAVVPLAAYGRACVTRIRAPASMRPSWSLTFPETVGAIKLGSCDSSRTSESARELSAGFRSEFPANSGAGVGLSIETKPCAMSRYKTRHSNKPIDTTDATRQSKAITAVGRCSKKGFRSEADSLRRLVAAKR